MTRVWAILRELGSVVLVCLFAIVVIPFAWWFERRRRGLTGSLVLDLRAGRQGDRVVADVSVGFDRQRLSRAGRLVLSGLQWEQLDRTLVEGARRTGATVVVEERALAELEAGADEPP